MTTDECRIDWLIKRVAYLEHSNKDGRPAVKAGRGEGQYWPQTEEDFGGAQDEAMVDLNLLDYIDAQIELEKK